MSADPDPPCSTFTIRALLQLHYASIHTLDGGGPRTPHSVNSHLTKITGSCLLPIEVIRTAIDSLIESLPFDLRLSTTSSDIDTPITVRVATLVSRLHECGGS